MTIQETGATYPCVQYKINGGGAFTACPTVETDDPQPVAPITSLSAVCSGEVTLTTFSVIEENAYPSIAERTIYTYNVDGGTLTVNTQDMFLSGVTEVSSKLFYQCPMWPPAGLNLGLCFKN